MARPHPYTTSSLPAGDARFIARSPGVLEIERLFPSPASKGKGRIAVEGGVSVVAGPGMGKTSLLTALAARLDRDRQLATALVTLPRAADFPGERGFYAYLGDLVRRLRTALAASPRMGNPPFAPVAAALAAEPAWDVPADDFGAPAGMTPRGVERWIAGLGAAAVHGPGVCLLFDDVDEVTHASWKSAFVAALRFVFQTSSGITPVYALWRVFADESLPGSNYFRNVTRPVFLEPLAATAGPDGGPSERRQLVELGLPGLSEAAFVAISRTLGGHPQLLAQALGDLCDGLPDELEVASLDAAAIEARLAPIAGAHRALARRLLEELPGLEAAVREVAHGDGSRPAAKGLVAAGLVDRDEHGRAFVPVRIAEAL